MKIVVSQSELKDIIDYYKSVKSLRKTAKYYKKSRSFLTKLLKENNVSLEKSCFNLKCRFNEDIFNFIDNEEKAYWFGFLYADGHLDVKNNSLRLELQNKDLNHIVKFCKFINYDIGKIKFREEKNTNFINISSKKMSTDLQNLNFKSSNLSIEFIPRKYYQCFLRGFYDGDGSIYRIGKKSLGTGLIATKDQLEIVYSIVPVNGKIRPVAKTKPEGMYRFETYNLKDSIILCNYLYQNATIYLDRKYIKYQDFRKEASTTIISQP